jgi:hypothetical protein
MALTAAPGRQPAGSSLPERISPHLYHADIRQQAQPIAITGLKVVLSLQWRPTISSRPVTRRVSGSSFRDPRTKSGLRLRSPAGQDDSFLNQRSDFARTRQVRTVASNINAGLRFKISLPTASFSDVRFQSHNGLIADITPCPLSAKGRSRLFFFGWKTEHRRLQFHACES